MNTIQQGLADFAAAKKALEKRLHSTIAGELAAFTELTGQSVIAIEVNLRVFRPIGAPDLTQVEAVRASISLG